MHGVDESRVKLWIDALRSGEFKQANGWLEKPIDLPDGTKATGNCCLGVAQHIGLRNGWRPADGVSEHDLDWGAAAMPIELGQWFGFEWPYATDPNLGEHAVTGDDGTEGITTVHCVEANDDLDWNFTRIADALEDRYITPVTSKESNPDG